MPKHAKQPAQPVRRSSRHKKDEEECAVAEAAEPGQEQFVSPPEPRLDKLPVELLLKIAKYLITPPTGFVSNKAPIKGKEGVRAVFSGPPGRFEPMPESEARLRPVCERGLNISVAAPLLHLAHSSVHFFKTLIKSGLFEPVWKALYLDFLRPHFYGDFPGENGPLNTSKGPRVPKGGWKALVDKIGGYKCVAIAVSRVAECDRCLRMDNVGEIDENGGCVTVEKRNRNSNWEPENLEFHIEDILEMPWTSGCFCCEYEVMDENYIDWTEECPLCETRYSSLLDDRYGCGWTGVYCYNGNTHGMEGHGCRVCNRAHPDIAMLASGLVFDSVPNDVWEDMEDEGLITEADYLMGEEEAEV